MPYCLRRDVSGVRRIGETSKNEARFAWEEEMRVESASPPRFCEVCTGFICLTLVVILAAVCLQAVAGPAFEAAAGVINKAPPALLARN